MMETILVMKAAFYIILFVGWLSCGVLIVPKVFQSVKVITSLYKTAEKVNAGNASDFDVEKELQKIEAEMPALKHVNY